MLKYLTYILLSTWPILQLVKLYSFGKGGLVVLDALMPFVILLLCLALIMMFLQKRQIKIGSPFILWLIFFLYVIINFYLNGSNLSLGQVCRDQFKISIMPLALYFIIKNFGGYFNRKVLVFSIIISGITIAGIGLAEFAVGHNLIGELNYEATHIQSVYRTNGPFQEAIGYSTIVLLYIPFTYYYLKEKIISKSLFLLLFIVFSAGFLVTLARASIVAYLMILLILLSRNSLKAIFINLYLFLALGLCVYMSWEFISTSKIFIKRITDPGNVIGRWHQFKECLNILIANPLKGIGYGNYKATHQYFIHNTYLRNLVELGLIGFFFHVIFIASVAFSNFKKAFQKGSHHLLRVRLSFIIILVIVPNTIDLLSNQYFILLLFAMIAVLNFNSESNVETINSN